MKNNELLDLITILDDIQKKFERQYKSVESFKKYSTTCIFRRMAASDSGRWRPQIPMHVGHRFRTMTATF